MEEHNRDMAFNKMLQSLFLKHHSENIATTTKNQILNQLIDTIRFFQISFEDLNNQKMKLNVKRMTLKMIEGINKLEKIKNDIEKTIFDEKDDLKMLEDQLNNCNINFKSSRYNFLNNEENRNRMKVYLDRINELLGELRCHNVGKFAGIVREVDSVSSQLIQLCSKNIECSQQSEELTLEIAGNNIECSQ